ncbi:MAG: choice-of-anchor D domain-containing protein [Bacteroidetes bacterium]|nr:choice-of-anchor D domain-containing protein [Bacteroidota bacterium]
MLTPDIGATVSGTTQFAFRADPTTVGGLSSVYRMISGNPLCPRQQHITFTTSVTNAELSLSPAIVDFGDVCIGEFKDQEITVTNSGSEAGVISSRQFVSGRNAFPNQHFNPFGPISPGESRQYRVRFAPGVNDIGNVEAVYNLIVDPCKDTLRLVLRGRGVRPGITFTPTSVLGLGPVPAGQITEKDVTITNSGNATMEINAISLAPLHPRLILTNLPALPASLPAGQSITARVRFDSDRSETILANLCVHWSSPCADSSCLPVAATSGEGPDIEVASQLDMGTEYCAVAHRDTLWVKNVGGGVLIISRFLLGGSNPAHFTVQAPSTPSQVAPGDSVAVILDFFRPDNGISTAELTIEHDDSKVGGNSVVQLRAERQSVEFQVQGDTLTPFVSCVRIGTNRSLQIRNRGIEDLEVRDISIIDGGAAFGVSSTPLPALIPGGSGLSFEVNFTPTLKGVFNATVRITVGPCDDTYLVNLTGEGNITELSFTPDPVEFGSVDAGATDTRIVRISNAGATAVSVSDISLRPGNTEFSLISVPTLPVIINAGASREVTVQFEPQTIGTITGQLCATVTSPCPDTLCVPIRGRGNSIGLGVTKTRMEFRLDPCNSDERCDSIDLLNSAGTPVSITDVRIEASTGFRVELPEALPFQLAAGARATLRICALADFTGSRTGNLIIESDDVNVPLIRVPLQSMRDSSAIRSSVSVLDFGFIAPCEIGSSQFVTVHNTGSVSEFVDTLRRLDAFIVSSALPVALQPATLTQLRVTFLPPAFGSFEDTLYLTTARCDLRVPVVLRGTMLEENYTVTPTPLEFTNVAVGSNETRNFSFSNLHLPYVRISDVRISPAGTFASWGAYPKTVPLGDVVELPILYNPKDAGPHSATACIIIDLPCPDTLCLPLNGSTGAGALVAIPPELEYGIVPDCADSILYDTLRNIGAGSITLRSNRVEGSAASLFTVENPILAPEQLASGAERVFEIRARSSAAPADGDYGAELIVETDNSAQPTLTVPLGMERRTLRISDDMTVDYGTIYVDAPATRSVTLVNRGTMDLIYRSGDLPAGVVIEPSLPISIPPGGTVLVDITYIPRFPGNWESTLTLHTGSPCELNTRLTLRGEVRTAFTVTDVDFGHIPQCTPSSVISAVLHNVSTVEASVVSARFEGNPPGTFTLIRPDAFPVPLPAASSFEVEIVYDPDPAATPAAYTTTLVLTTESSRGTQEHRVAVSVHVRSGWLAFLTSPHFGEYSLGRASHVLQARFRNENNFPITIDAANIEQSLPGNFSLIGTTPELPVTLGRSEVLQVHFVFETQVEGRVDARLQLQQSAPCPGTDSYEIYAFGVDDAIRAELSIDAHTGVIDEILHIPIRLHTDLDHADVISWEGNVAFNPSMLHPLSVVTEGTLSADMQVSMEYDNASGQLLIQARDGLLSDGTGDLAILRFLVLVGDDNTTPLTLMPDFDFTSGRARVETKRDGSFTLLGYCDASGNRFIRPTAGLIMQPNRPNPFSEHTVIEYEIADDGPVDLRVHDHMGREVARLVSLPAQSAGRYRVILEAATLPPGVYFAILRDGTDVVVRKMLRMP